MDRTPLHAAWVHSQGTRVAVVDEHGALGPLCLEALRGTRFLVAEVVSDPLDLRDVELEAAVVGCGSSPLERPRLLAELTAERPEVPAVAVVASGGVSVRRALAAGARSVVRDDALTTVLSPTLEAMLAGQLCQPLLPGRGGDRVVLSHREKQVLELVARGLTNSEIGGQLYLAPSTVKTHLATSFRKIGVRSRAEAAALVLDPATWSDLGMSAIVDDALHTLAAGA